jgi:hypothetical protein
MFKSILGIYNLEGCYKNIISINLDTKKDSKTSFLRIFLDFLQFLPKI